jgi:hypothetical protein
MKLARQNCRLEVSGMQEYGIHKVHMRMLPEETEVKEELEANDRQVQLLNLGLGLKRA